MKDLLKPKVRRWAYGVAVAVTGYLGVKGIVSSEEAQSLNLLASALFGVALANVSDDEQ